MKYYDSNILVDIIESKMLDLFDEYCPQGCYNNTFIKYLYRFIRESTYTGEHDETLRQFVNLTLNNPEFKNTKVKESTNRKTYTITDTNGITDSMFKEIQMIVKDYYNYNYRIIAQNRVQVDFNFGWLPQNTISWLNLINDDCIIDYHIDGITLVKNTHSVVGDPRPDSGYVCYLIDNTVREYDTVMFLYNKDAMELEDGEYQTIPKYTVATILTDIAGSKGATLNRQVDFNLDNFFYELGPYSQNYLTTQKSSLVIQVPYDYAISGYYYLYDVSNSVKINPKNNIENPNDPINYFVKFSDEYFSERFLKFNLENLDIIMDRIFNHPDTIDRLLMQYILGDFIWITSDSKLIAYAQNLLNTLYGDNSYLTPNGEWSKTMSQLVTRFKSGDNYASYFDDDVIDKQTEESMLNEYKKITNFLDPNEELFNEW